MRTTAPGTLDAVTTTPGCRDQRAGHYRFDVQPTRPAEDAEDSAAPRRASAVFSRAPPRSLQPRTAPQT